MARQSLNDNNEICSQDLSLADVDNFIKSNKQEINIVLMALIFRII